MLILGIDPGTATTGYGLVKVVNGKRLQISCSAIDWGLIETDKEMEAPERLKKIHDKMKKIINEFEPDVMAIERLFFASNAKTAMRVGQAQGVMMLSLAQKKIQVVEYAPGTIKKTVAGDGKADKKDIQRSLRRVFGARVRSSKKGKTHFDNAADALAVALCHAFHTRNVSK